MEKAYVTKKHHLMNFRNSTFYTFSFLSLAICSHFIIHLPTKTANYKVKQPTITFSECGRLWCILIEPVIHF